MGKRMSRRDEWNADSSRKQELNEKIELLMEEEAGNLFKDYEKAHRTMSVGGRRVVMLAVFLAGALLLSLILNAWGILVAPFGGIVTDQWSYTLAEYRELVVYQAGELITFITTGSGAFGPVVKMYLVIIVAGYAMSVTGAVYQGLFANPMASPTTMGVNAGGVLGGLFYALVIYDTMSLTTFRTTTSSYSAMHASELIAYYNSLNIFQRSAQSLCILAGCFLGVMIILAISMAAGRGKVSTVALLLAGSVFSTVITEIGQLVQYYLSMYGDEDKATLVSTLIGGNYIVRDYTWSEMLFFCVPVIGVSILVFALANKINIIAFGEAEARAMGVNVTRCRNGLIAACTVLSALVLSFCGQVSMVGFLMPHLARYLVGPDFKKLVPASALLGGITTLVVYDLCYMMAATGSFNLYTGVACSIISAIFIIFYRRNRHADWS